MGRMGYFGERYKGKYDPKKTNASMMAYREATKLGFNDVTSDPNTMIKNKNPVIEKFYRHLLAKDGKTANDILANGSISLGGGAMNMPVTINNHNNITVNVPLQNGTEETARAVAQVLSREINNAINNRAPGGVSLAPAGGRVP